MTLQDEIQAKINGALRNRDKEALDILLHDLYEKADEARRPFDAAIQMKPDIRAQIANEALESDAALGFANRIARAKRLVEYSIKSAGGFDGLRIVEEGDSWFQYPLLLKDTIDHLSDDADKAIYPLSGAGDLLVDMARSKDYIEALRKTGAGILLLSGGGNDLLGSGRFKDILLPFNIGSTPAEHINGPVFEGVVAETLQHYRVILTDIRTQSPGVKVLSHAYDVAFPLDDGKWLGQPLKRRGIPLDFGREIVELVLHRFTTELKRLEEGFPNYRLVNLKGKIDRGKQSWHDELHPKDAGYGRAAEGFRAAISELADAGALETAPIGIHLVPDMPVTARAAGLPSGIGFGGPIVLDPGHGGTATIGGSSWNNAIGPNGTLEKTLTLDVAKRAQAILEARGHTVLLTRTTDINVGLADRAAVAHQVKAPVFVSIHFNASNAHNAQGTETFVHTSNSNASRRLCLAVQGAMVAELGLRDRNALHPGGIKKAGFGVINPGSHASETAAVLHEVSFLDRVAEEAKLLTDAYRRRTATALADGIEAYLGTELEAAPMLVSEIEEIGDAIELLASEAGQPVMSYLGLAEALTGDTAAVPVADHVGGHMLPDALPESDWRGDFVTRLAAMETDFVLPGSVVLSDDEDDINEFSTVEIGDGQDLAGLSGSFETNKAILGSAFEGMETSGFNMAAFERFVASLGLRYFSASELLFMGSSNRGRQRCAGKNQLPPQHLWQNVANTARMLDAIRDRLGAPVRILSGYRSDAYNACVGGASRSHHKSFNAFDWKCEKHRVADWHEAAQALRGSSSDFRGGVGQYNTFVHIDTRGTDANWNG